jgi:transcriptional regulator with XRE-family HTH domain
MTKKFGELFRDERKRSGKTMGDLARHLSVSVTYLSDVERCTRPALTPARIRSADALMNTSSSTLHELMRAAQDEQGEILLPLPSSEVGRETGAALQRKWATLDDDEFAKIMDVIKKGE